MNKRLSLKFRFRSIILAQFIQFQSVMINAIWLILLPLLVSFSIGSFEFNPLSQLQSYSPFAKHLTRQRASSIRLMSLAWIMLKSFAVWSKYPKTTIISQLMQYPLQLRQIQTNVPIFYYIKIDPVWCRQNRKLHTRKDENNLFPGINKFR